MALHDMANIAHWVPVTVICSTVIFRLDSKISFPVIHLTFSYPGTRWRWERLPCPPRGSWPPRRRSATPARRAPTAGAAWPAGPQTPACRRWAGRRYWCGPLTACLQGRTHTHTHRAERAERHSISQVPQTQMSILDVPSRWFIHTDYACGPNTLKGSGTAWGGWGGGLTERLPPPLLWGWWLPEHGDQWHRK